MTHYPQEKIKPYNESEGKAAQVEKMFDNIAPAYDKLNHLLSLPSDRLASPFGAGRAQVLQDVCSYRRVGGVGAVSGG